MQALMARTKRELEAALPFAMEPVVYDFAINERGTWAELLDTETWRHGDRGHGDTGTRRMSPRRRVPPSPCRRRRSCRPAITP